MLLWCRVALISFRLLIDSLPSIQREGKRCVCSSCSNVFVYTLTIPERCSASELRMNDRISDTCGQRLLGIQYPPLTDRYDQHFAGFFSKWTKS
jgi:hypothetical protein